MKDGWDGQELRKRFQALRGQPRQAGCRQGIFCFLEILLRGVSACRMKITWRQTRKGFDVGKGWMGT